jgi:hypothetical protein
MLSGRTNVIFYKLQDSFASIAFERKVKARESEE